MELLKDVGLGADDNMSANPWDWIDLINRVCKEANIDLKVRITHEQFKEHEYDTRITHKFGKKRRYSYKFRGGWYTATIEFITKDKTYYRNLVDFGYPQIPKEMYDQEKIKK